jgi:hypothetical protein
VILIDLAPGHSTTSSFSAAPDGTRRKEGGRTGAIQSDALTLRIFRDMAGFDHDDLLEISLRVPYREWLSTRNGTRISGAA